MQQFHNFHVLFSSTIAECFSETFIVDSHTQVLGCTKDRSFSYRSIIVLRGFLGAGHCNVHDGDGKATKPIAHSERRAIATI